MAAKIPMKLAAANSINPLRWYLGAAKTLYKPTNRPLRKTPLGTPHHIDNWFWLPALTAHLYCFVSFAHALKKPPFTGGRQNRDVNVAPAVIAGFMWNPGPPNPARNPWRTCSVYRRDPHAHRSHPMTAISTAPSHRPSWDRIRSRATLHSVCFSKYPGITLSGGLWLSV